MKHGETINGKSSSEYNTWNLMIRRCLNPKDKRYKHYGGRGIKVCDRWLESNGQGFINFLRDMGKKPTSKHSLDRKDNDKGYFPENCRWATDKEQQNNKSNNNCITHNGQTKTLTQWSELLGISTYTIRKRINLGWSIEEALTKELTVLEPELIIQMDLNGNLIKEWDSINKASKGLGISTNTIRQIINGKTKKPKKFIFNLKNNKNEKNH